MRKILALADCNNFFVSCEILKNPSLKGKPVCVLSNCDGCIVSRSNEAKKLGITMGMPLFMAKKQFPNAIYLSGDMKLYHDISKRVMKILRNFTSCVEVCSIDEAFLDVTGLCSYYNVDNYEQLAKFLHLKILQEVGIPVSVGISTSKILCKIAVHKAKKTNFYYYIPFENIEQEVQDFQIEDIWGVGKSIKSILKGAGIFTAGDILKKDKEFFSHYLGKKGLEIKFGIEGENTLPIATKETLPKSIQKTESFTEFTNNKTFLKTSILKHLHLACKKMRKYGILTEEITVMMRTKDFRVLTQSERLLSPTNSELVLNKLVLNLFEKLYSKNILYRSTGIYVHNFKTENTRQLQLINSCEKFDSVSKILDKIENKYGNGIISVGVNS